MCIRKIYGLKNLIITLLLIVLIPFIQLYIIYIHIYFFTYIYFTRNRQYVAGIEGILEKQDILSLCSYCAYFLIRVKRKGSKEKKRSSKN